MILNHNNIAIFSLPRTGTKLLASIFEQLGYHNYGELYSIRSTEIIDGRPIRLDKHIEFTGSISENKFKRVFMYEYRYKLFESSIGNSPFEKNVINVWPDSICEFPFILNHLQNYHFVAVKRNPWDQILSYYISSKNFNFDAKKISVAVAVNRDMFQKMYWDYFRATRFQDWIVSNNRGSIIDFDQLITGNIELFNSQTYSITTVDEHSNLESLIQNIDEVRGWFIELDKKRYKMENCDEYCA